MEKLAQAQPEKIRPLFQIYMSDFSRAASESRTEEADHSYALALAVAGFSQELFNDPFPENRIKLFRSWTPDQHRLKTEADDLLKESMAAYDQGRYGDVTTPGNAALEIYTRLGDVSGQGETLHYLGQAQRRLADYPQALILHHRALDLAIKASDPLLQGRSLIDIGDVHERKKDQKTAEKFYREAIQILKSPAFGLESATAHRQLGDVYVATGDFENAYQSFSAALSQAEKANDASRIAEFNDYIGFCYRRLGDYHTADIHHRRALENSAMIASAEDRSRAKARSLNHLGICIARLAEVHAAEGDQGKAAEKYGEAIAYEEEALAPALQIADRWRQGYILRALSSMHRELGALLENPKAKPEYEKSLLRADQAHELGMAMEEKEWQGLALHDRALALKLLGRNQEGLETFHQALALWDEIGDFQSAGYAHRFVANRFHESNGSFADAEASYDRAIQAFEKIGDIESQAFTMMDKARVLALQGQKNRAVGLYDAGIAKLEAVRIKAGLPEFRKAFMGKVYDRYEEAALFALGQDFNDRALRIVESMKARTFLDQLAEERVELEKGIDPELKKKRDALENALSAEIENIADAYRNSTPDEKRPAASKDRLERIGTELDRLKKQIRLQNPLYASVQYPDPVTAAELQKKILSPEEVLLEYFVASQDIYCFIITANRFESVKLSISEPELSAKVDALLDNLRSGPARGEGYDRFQAAELYEILIRPFAKILSGKTLVIVPDGILITLPFETLIAEDNGERSYLLEKYAVKYVQSATILKMLRTHHNSPPPGERFIGFGDPVYDYDNFKQGKPEGDAPLPGRGLSAGISKSRYAELGGRLTRLEASGDEVRAIERIFAEQNKGDLFLREKAREEFAKGTGMGQYGYIHFSMHGIVTPGLQAVAFSRIPDSAEDGLLTMGEIMNLRYNARLVVLSACGTGLGKMERGEGITGLTRAVIYAGSPAAVVSLWSVDDNATRELMIRFYENMIRKGVDRSEALRRAKQEMAGTRYRHPYFWAAFVMYGE